MSESSARPLVALTTDFGTGSPYVAALHGVLLGINPDVAIVDVTHDVPPQNVLHVARLLPDVWPYFREGTIHVVVVDPGVGTARPLIYAEIAGRAILCPDNGIVTGLLRLWPAKNVRRLANRDLWRPSVSHTFHGRDILAPVAGRLSLSSGPLAVSPEMLGPPHTIETLLDWPDPEISAGRIVGEVESIDSFGNLITNIDSASLARCALALEPVRVACEDHETFGIFRTYGDVEPRTLIALIGSHGRLELAVSLENAASLLGIEVGRARHAHMAGIADEA